MKVKKENEPIQISIRDLSVNYGDHKALESITGDFQPGSLTAVIGSNGSGKSTLLKAIMGLLKTKKGAIGPHYFRLRKKVAYLPQQANIDRSFPLRVEDFVCTGLWNKIRGFRSVSYLQHLQVHKVLEHLGLGGFEERTLDALSGGQFQRVLFARLMMQDKPIILLDEPFAGIDQQTIRDLIKIILEWHKQGKTVVTVLHDIDLVRKYFPNSILLDKKLLSWGRTEDVLSHKDLWTVSGFVHTCHEESTGD